MVTYWLTYGCDGVSCTGVMYWLIDRETETGRCITDRHTGHTEERHINRHTEKRRMWTTIQTVRQTDIWIAIES